MYLYKKPNKPVHMKFKPNPPYDYKKKKRCFIATPLDLSSFNCDAYGMLI